MSEQAPTQNPAQEMKDATILSHRLDASQAVEGLNHYNFDAESTYTQSLDAQGRPIAETAYIPTVTTGSYDQDIVQNSRFVVTSARGQGGAEKASVVQRQHGEGLRDTQVLDTLQTEGLVDYRNVTSLDQDESTNGLSAASVSVDRKSFNRKTGEVEQGAVTQLTGERAVRANEILTRRAAKAVGAAAIKRGQSLIDAYQNKTAS